MIPTVESFTHYLLLPQGQLSLRAAFPRAAVHMLFNIVYFYDDMKRSPWTYSVCLQVPVML
jgi:hypothetical protein